MLTCTSVYTTRHFSLDYSLFITREALSHLPLLHVHTAVPVYSVLLLVLPSSVLPKVMYSLMVSLGELEPNWEHSVRVGDGVGGGGVSVCRRVGGTRGRVEKERGKKTDA